MNGTDLADLDRDALIALVLKQAAMWTSPRMAGAQERA